MCRLSNLLKLSIIIIVGRIGLLFSPRPTKVHFVPAIKFFLLELGQLGAIHQRRPVRWRRTTKSSFWSFTKSGRPWTEGGGRLHTGRPQTNQKNVFQSLYRTPTSPRLRASRMQYILCFGRFWTFLRAIRSRRLWLGAGGRVSSKRTMLNRGVYKESVFARTSLMDDPL